MINIKLSNRALAQMVSGIQRVPDTIENGGLLLGYEKENQIYIVEAIDAGKNADREATKVVFDENMAYYASVLIDLYEEPLRVVGIWHKHNHSYNPPFSQEDNFVHQRLVEETENDILSILFQKESEGDYVMKVFRYNSNGQLKQEEFDVEEVSKLAHYRY